jgi:hypothetical protein
MTPPELAMKVGRRRAAFPARRSPPPRGDRQGHAAFGLHDGNALVAGFTSVGMDVVLLGPMPTPAVAMLTRSMRADLGVMISASHNPFQDNGIKLFGPTASSFPTRTRLAIEAMLGEDIPLAAPPDIGRARRDRGCARALYPCGQAELPRQSRLDGLRIVVDCANGAAYQVAPSASVGTGRGSRRHRRLAQWQEHQRQMRIDRIRRCCRSRGETPARISASRWMAMPTG